MTRSTLGRLFFAFGLAASGIQQLATGDFVRLVTPGPPGSPGHSVQAMLIGLLLLAAGLALAVAKGRRARWAAAGVGVMLLLLFLVRQLPLALAKPQVGFLWTNPCKVLALLAGAILLIGTLPEDDVERPSALARLGRGLLPLAPLFLGGFLLLAGVQHFVYADFVAQLVPAWIPLTRFWVYFTGVALFAGGLGMLIPRTARLAATLAGIMIFLWVVLLHIPRAVTLHNAGETSAIFEALALSGVALMLADRRRPEPEPASTRRQQVLAVEP
jgi:uncharacterized membrane protein